MKRDDWMLFGLTFLTGVAIGMYLYIAAWKPVYAPEELGGEEAEANQWSVIGERRDGASFRLLGNGSYNYLGIDESGESLPPREGSIGRRKAQELKVSPLQLEAYAQSAECSAPGEDHQQYQITVDGETYLLDTCETLLGKDSPLARQLTAVWETIEGKKENTPSRTPAEWVENWISENFGFN